MRKRWLDVVLEGAFVVGVMAGIGYATAVVVCRIVTRWLGGAF